MKPDTIYFGGRIYPMDANHSVHEAMAVKNGKILKVADNESIMAMAGGDTELVNLNQKVMFPGFIDSHVHAPGNAYNVLFNIDLYAAQSAEETEKAIADFIEKHPEKPAYYGRGFNPGVFEGIESIKGPSKKRLDRICKDKPILLTDFGGHVIWANSAALEKYGITKDTVSPEGGVIEKDSETGELWGTLKEYARQMIPYQPFTKEENTMAAKWFQEQMHSYGYTSIFSFGPPGAIIPRETIFEAFYEMERQGELKLRVSGARDMAPEEEPEEQIQELLALREKYETALIRVTAAKYFADGVVDAVTACLLAPYAPTAGQAEDFKGEFIWDRKRMEKAFALTLEAGFQIHVHSIGDGATRYTLDALEDALRTVDAKDPRTMITHLQLVDPEDIRRMAALKVIASVQTFWHFKDPNLWFTIEKPFLGVERAENQYPLKSFLDAGIKIAASSDCPVTQEPYPFVAIQLGVTRSMAPVQAPDQAQAQFQAQMHPQAQAHFGNGAGGAGGKRLVLNIEEGITTLDMIRAYTIDGAYALNRENEIGSLEAGKYADFILVDQDPFEVNPHELSTVKVLATYFNGARVF